MSAPLAAPTQEGSYLECALGLRPRQAVALPKGALDPRAPTGSTVPACVLAKLDGMVFEE